LARNERWQPAALLLLGAEHHHRVETEDIHVHRRAAGEAGARFGDRLHHHRGLADAEPRAAVRFRHRDAKPTVASASLVKIAGEFAVAIAREPVVVAEAVAKLADRLANPF